MRAKTITALFYDNRDNLSDKWEQYLAVYDAELRPWRNKRVSLLEIGVQNGGSMQLWSQYFAPSSAFIGLDIDERILELTHPENVSLKVADASDPVALDAALGDTTFDVIIDDGSHRSEHIIRSFQLLFGRLRPGGRYFIEDLHCAYWSAYGGGLTRTTSAIEYLKQLIDVVHADHIEGDEQLTIDATDELLTALRRGLAKVTFYDSLAVIERLPFDKLRPYRRVLAGEHGDLVDPLELLQIEDPGAIHFTEPLARTLEQYLLRQRQAALAANKELEQELEAERSAFSGFREEVESERARVRAHSDELEAQLALADAALANAAVERTKAEHAMLAHFEAQRESAVDALGAALLANRRLERTISAMTSQIEELLEQAKGLEQIPHLRNQIEAIERSLTHRAMVPVRSAAQLTRRGLQRASRLRPARGGASGPRPAPTDDEPTPAPVAIAVDEQTVGRTEIEAAQSLHNSTVYGQWRHQYVNLQLDDRIMIDQQIASGTLPALTVVMRIDTDDGTATSAAIEALRCQRFTDWRAVLVVADGAHLPEARAAAERHVSADARLSFVTTDTAPIGWTDSPVLLTSASTRFHEHALYLFAEAAAGGAQLAYADAEFLDTATDRLVPVFKPEYSPVYQETTAYVGETLLVSPDDGTASALAALDPTATTAGEVLSHLRQQLTPSMVRRIPFVVQTETRRSVPTRHESAFDPSATPTATVSIIIPTRDRLELLRPCIESILGTTTYPAHLIEIVVVDNGSTDPATLAYLDALTHSRQATIIRDDGGFNYPRLNNRAAAQASGDVLVLLNNDTTIIDPAWLAHMVAYATQPGVGAVGGKLLYPDGSVQHGGVVLGVQGVAAHVNHQMFDDNLVYEPVADFTHEASAVTAACLAIRRDVYQEVGGLDERLAVAFNDIDLCCATLAHGMVNIYIGDALAVHHESKSRGYDVTPEQVATFHQEAHFARSKYPALYRNDAYYDPNWSLTRTHGLAAPSRATRPWRLAHRRSGAPRTILLLADSQEQGPDIGLVVDLQARHLAALGHRVIVGRPASDVATRSTQYEHATINDEFQAAEFTVTCGADAVIMHSPPFYGVPRWIGDEQLTIAIDHGARPIEWLDDPMHRLAAVADRRFGMALANRRFATSLAAQRASTFADTELLPLGNDHLGIWSEQAPPVRQATRAGHGWTDKLVVLFVPRDDADASRNGTDEFVALATALRIADPELADRVAFVAVTSPAEHESLLGVSDVTSFTGVGPADLAGVYVAADLYAATSSWQGLGLGAQHALAFGLPVVTTDVAGLDVAGVTTVDSFNALVAHVEQAARAPQRGDTTRTPLIAPWRDHLDRLTCIVMSDQTLHV